MTYLEWIEQTTLVREVDTCVTSGDLDYPGIAFEVCSKAGDQILHVVVDSAGEQQVLLLTDPNPLRVPLSLLQKILERAKDVVMAVDIPEP